VDSVLPPSVRPPEPGSLGRRSRSKTSQPLQGWENKSRPGSQLLV
jgi:hypothetical protein